MIALTLLLGCASADWEDDWKGDWGGAITFDGGMYASTTRTIEFVDLRYAGHPPSWSEQEGRWQAWHGQYFIDTDPGVGFRPDVDVWQCEDEDECTTPGLTVPTGDYVATCLSGTTPYLVISGTFGEPDAEGVLGDAAQGNAGPVTLNPL